MSGGFDGSIRIDTSVDTGGLNKGTKKISSSLEGVLRSIKAIGKALIAAFVGGSIVSAIRSLIGDFDLMHSSISASLKPLGDAITTLKGTFVNLIATALIPLIPYIVIVVNWLTHMLQIVTMVVAALFGMQKTVGSISKDSKKAARETQKSLASFDQLNVLNKNKNSGDDESPMITPPPLSVTQEIMDTVDKIKKKFEELWQLVVKGAVDSWLFFMSVWLPASRWVEEHIIKPIRAWISENPEKFKVFALILGLVILAFILLGVVIVNWTLITAIASGVAGVFAIALAVLSSPITLVILLILLLIGAVVLLILIWPTLAQAAEKAWKWIQAVFLLAAVWFKVMVIDKLQSMFFSMLDAVKLKFKTVFEGIRNIVLSIINGLINVVENMIQAIVNGINGVLTGANAIGGQMGIGSLPLLTAPSLPRLATGAVIPPNAQFAAILGDQKSGRNIETPEKLLRDIMDEKIGSMKAEIQIEFTGSLAELAKVLNPVMKKENVRVGGSLVKGTGNL